MQTDEQSSGVPHPRLWRRPTSFPQRGNVVVPVTLDLNSGLLKCIFPFDLCATLIFYSLHT